MTDAQGPGPVRVGYRPPHRLLEVGGPAVLRDVVQRAERLGIDHLCTGDHVTFHGGAGFDGLIHATAFAMMTSRLGVHTSVYLLPLRHPVLVARQVASLLELAPSRVVFGVGIGGEDRAEVLACGVDPATRGRRMDESLAVLRRLMDGERVTAVGEFFTLDEVVIRPVPREPLPIVIGGRSPAALRRVARLGDGWLGVWVSPKRFAETVAEIDDRARQLGRAGTSWRHGMTVWCGFGGSRAERRPCWPRRWKPCTGCPSRGSNAMPPGVRPRTWHPRCRPMWTPVAAPSTSSPWPSDPRRASRAWPRSASCWTGVAASGVGTTAAVARHGRNGRATTAVRSRHGPSGR